MTPAESAAIDREQVTTLYREKIASLRAEVERVAGERDAASENFLASRDARDAAIVERDAARAEVKRAHLAAGTAAFQAIDKALERDAVAAVLDDYVAALHEVVQRASLPITSTVTGLPSSEAECAAAIKACARKAIAHVSEPALAALKGYEMSESKCRDLVADVLPPYPILSECDLVAPPEGWPAWAEAVRAALFSRPPTSAPAPVPEDVVSAISELEAEVSGGAGCDDQRCPVDHIAEAKRLRTGLLAAISRALAEAREGALREAVTMLEAKGYAWAPDEIRALIPAHEEGGR